MKLILATTNKGKEKEINQYLDQFNFDIKSLNDIEVNIDEPSETAESFQENALQKAMHYFHYLKTPILAEDSGIKIEALPNEMGVKTKRWGAGENASGEEWIKYFLKRMKNEKNRNANFFSSICFVKSLEEIFIFSGECKGTILQETTSPLNEGIPLSSYFVPNGFNKSYIDLSINEKNKISHRGKAIGKFVEFLKNN
jgi:XTP/dITP diphosphohydrolase